MKLLLLQQWHCLSDPSLAEAVTTGCRSALFQPAAGPGRARSLDDLAVPPGTGAPRLSEALFAEISHQLDACGLIASARMD
jgi:hypothetical protein